jgi:hypothetical protein
LKKLAPEVLDGRHDEASVEIAIGLLTGGFRDVEAAVAGTARELLYRAMSRRV